MGMLHVSLFAAALGGGLRAAAAAAAGGAATHAVEDPSIKWMQMHGWLMWASMGFLFPLGTILIRYSRPQRDPTAVLSPGRIMLLFYLHCVVQCIALVASIAGVAILINKTGTNMDFTHERLGLALLIIAMMQPFIGLLRPGKGTEARPYWFVLHWVLGTGGLFLGIVNCYIGINAYQFITKRSLRSLNIAFSIQVSVMLLVYFLQDRWSYILGQRRIEKSLPIKAGPHQIGMSL